MGDLTDRVDAIEGTLDDLSSDLYTLRKSAEEKEEFLERAEEELDEPLLGEVTKKVLEAFNAEVKKSLVRLAKKIEES